MQFLPHTVYEVHFSHDDGVHPSYLNGLEEARWLVSFIMGSGAEQQFQCLLAFICPSRSFIRAVVCQTSQRKGPAHRFGFFRTRVSVTEQNFK